MDGRLHRVCCALFACSILASTLPAEGGLSAPNSSPGQALTPATTGFLKEILPDGTQVVFQVVDAKRHGPSRRLSSSGAVIEESYFKTDIQNGPYRSYHPNQQLAQEGYFLAGKKTGVWKEYDIRGRVVESLEWCDGRRFGPYERRFPNGTVAVRGSYVADLPDGTWKWYNERGVVLSRSEFERGTGTLMRYQRLETPRDDGDQTLYLAQEETLADGQRHGPTRTFFTDGSVESEVYYQRGVPHGSHTTFWPPNQLGAKQVVRSSGQYKGGQQEGRWRTWHASGVIESVCAFRNGAQDGQIARWYDIDDPKTKHAELKGQYKKGVRTGKWQEFFPEGQIKTAQSYSNDQLEGLATTYFPTGMKQSEAQFSKGYKDGSYVEYYPNGSIKIETTFTHDVLHGEYLFYHENEAIAIAGHYDSGLPDGEWKWFADEGERLIQSSSFQEGTGKMLAFYPDGVRKSEVQLVHGVKNGEEKVWYDNGYLKHEACYNYGLLNGLLREYYDDGFIALEANWEHGMRQGKQVQYYGNRQIQSEYCFIDDVPNGPIHEWYENGEIKVEGFWRLGKQSGDWAWFDRFGDCVRQQRFHTDDASSTASVEP